ncbi:unnamed protein product [Notodromas monacha]|uniref:Uncharacterized protein n=1 Tax=Notodromas monacha TaxID=399045 RepID=A0A7R9BPZ3_9CRUS|nr:unnamed protein product [Notodromas monacha]CAG0919498.1 unnamed protein product [Notodromas monacha]
MCHFRLEIMSLLVSASVVLPISGLISRHEADSSSSDSENSPFKLKKFYASPISLHQHHQASHQHKFAKRFSANNTGPKSEHIVKVVREATPEQEHKRVGLPRTGSNEESSVMSSDDLDLGPGDDSEMDSDLEQHLQQRCFATSPGSSLVDDDDEDDDGEEEEGEEREEEEDEEASDPEGVDADFTWVHHSRPLLEGVDGEPTGYKAQAPLSNAPELLKVVATVDVCEAILNELW